MRIGQVGVGAWGRFHFRLLAEMSNVHFVGAYYINDQIARANFPQNVREFTNLAELLREIDAVVVTAATEEHYQLALQALRQGVHVFVEKPICQRPEEADELIMEASRSGLVLQVGHIERFNPAYRLFMRKQVTPRFIEAHREGPFSARNNGVSVILDLMIHDLDLVLQMIDSPVKDVAAVGSPVFSDNIDYATARITFANESVAILTASRISPEKRRIMTVTDSMGGNHRLNFIDRNLAGPYFWNSENLCSSKKPDPVSPPEFASENLLQMELLAFINSVCKNEAPATDGASARSALALAQRVEDSIKGAEA